MMMHGTTDEQIRTSNVAIVAPLTETCGKACTHRLKETSPKSEAVKAAEDNIMKSCIRKCCLEEVTKKSRRVSFRLPSFQRFKDNKKQESRRLSREEHLSSKWGTRKQDHGKNQPMSIRSPVRRSSVEAKPGVSKPKRRLSALRQPKSHVQNRRRSSGFLDALSNLRVSRKNSSSSTNGVFIPVCQQSAIHSELVSPKPPTQPNRRSSSVVANSFAQTPAALALLLDISEDLSV